MGVRKLYPQAAFWLLVMVLALSACTMMRDDNLAGLSSQGFVTVTNTDDDGEGSLRQAITNAASGDTIAFADALVGETITLMSGELVIDKDLIILGPEQGITISGGNNSRVLSVTAGANVELHNLTVRDGFAPDGAGILNEGSLTMVNSSITHNSLSDVPCRGGGIYNDGTITIIDSAIANNGGGSAYCGQGGGIYNSGMLEMSGSSILGNTTLFDGAAAIHNIGTAFITDTLIKDNRNHGGGDGDIYNSGELTMSKVTLAGTWLYRPSCQAIVNTGILSFLSSTVSGYESYDTGNICNRGALNISSSSFFGNTSHGHTPGFGGGAIENSGTLTVSDSAFASNIAASVDTFSGAPSDGGAITNAGTAKIVRSTFIGNYSNRGGAISNTSKLTIINSTIYGNQAMLGGGIFNTGTLDVISSTLANNGINAYIENTGGLHNEGGIVTITSSILAGTSGDFYGPDESYYDFTNLNCFGPITDDGNNIDSGSTCSFTSANSSQSDTDPLLDPEGPKDHGGPTQTVALLPTSPAINAIPYGVNGCNAEDQRGVARPQGRGCDTGAFELEQGDPTITIGDILQAFDGYVAAGSVMGAGPGNSAGNRLNTFKNMLLSADRLLDTGNTVAACRQLSDTQKRIHTTGRIHPSHFVTGAEAGTLYALIDDLKDSIGCR